MKEPSSLHDAEASLEATQAARYATYRDYRASRVDWLGDVPRHWDVKRLKFVLERNDSGVWGDEDDPSGTVVLRSTEQTVDGGWRIDEPARRALTDRERRSAMLISGDLVVTKSSGSSLHIGKTSLVSSEVAQLEPCFSNFMQRLRTNQSLDPRWVYYLLNCPTGRQQLVYNSNTTTGLANLNGTILGNVWCSFPEPSEQAEILEFLDDRIEKIDSLVNARRELMQLFKEKRQAVMAHFLTEGLNQDIELRDSGIAWLGDVPRHWDVKRLKFVLERNDSGVWGDEDDPSGTVVLRSTEQTVDGGWRIDEPARRALTDRERRSAMLISGDLVVTKSSGSSLHIGKTSLVSSEVAQLEPCFSNFMQRLRTNQSLDPRWVYYLLNCPTGRQQLVYNSNTTTGLANLNGTILGNVWCSFPEPSEQAEILKSLEGKVGIIDELARAVQDSIRHLACLRLSLISAALTGEIDVRGGTA